MEMPRSELASPAVATSAAASSLRSLSEYPALARVFPELPGSRPRPCSAVSMALRGQIKFVGRRTRRRLFGSMSFRHPTF